MLGSPGRWASLALLASLAPGCGDSASGGNPAGPTGGGAGAPGSSTTGGGGAAGGPLEGAAGSAAQAGQGGSSGSSSAGDGGAGGGGGSGGGASGGGGGSGGERPGGSEGCGSEAGQALGSWVEQPALSVNAKDRQWWVWLPSGYDPARPYPLVFTFHGCGGPDNILPLHEVAGEQAILVRGTGITDGCWTYGSDGDDVKMFDAMLAEVASARCVDTSRVFATGYSSGAWLVNTLGCARGDKLRATGTVSGGVVGNRGACSGKYARITIHDLGDTTNGFATQGASDELERVVEQNHCTADTPPVMEDPAPCARYQGCDPGYPVIACLTQGKGHDRQDALAKEAFWRLFSAL